MDPASLRNLRLRMPTFSGSSAPAAPTPPVFAQPSATFAFARSRAPSLARSIVDFIRPGPSVARLPAPSVYEEVLRSGLPTKLICQGHTPIRVPASLNAGALPKELLRWLRSNALGELGSSARLIQPSGTQECKLLVDDDEALFAVESDVPYIYLQITDIVMKVEVPANSTVFYILYLNEKSFASEPWSPSANSSFPVESFLLPYCNSLRIALYTRKIADEPKKSKIFKKKRAVGPTYTEVFAGDVHFDLLPVDYGKEHKTVLLCPYAYAPTGSAEYPAITIQLGIWTGAGERLKAQQEATYEGYLTIQMSALSPHWKRYWAAIDVRGGAFNLYDFEYKKAKLHKTLPLYLFRGVEEADAEEYPMPNVFLLTTVTGAVSVSSNLDDLTSSQKTLVLGNSNRITGSHQSVGSIDLLNEIVCRADTTEEVAVWYNSLKCAISMAAAGSAAQNLAAPPFLKKTLQIGEYITHASEKSATETPVTECSTTGDVVIDSDAVISPVSRCLPFLVPNTQTPELAQ